MTISGGTNVEMVTYYDIAKEIKSVIFENVLTEFDNNVLYIEFNNGDCSAVIKNIFSEEIVDTFEIDLKGANIATAGSFSAEYDSETRELSITHPSGEDYDNVTEVFIIK